MPFTKTININTHSAIYQTFKYFMVPLQFIVHTNTSAAECQEIAMLALAGGCKWIRLHFDNNFTESKEELASQLLKACRQHEATFVIDNEVELCKAIEADGVHLTETTMHANEVRELLGHEFIIGGTAHTFADIKRLKGESADYICCGPFKDTMTTPAPAPALGIEGYEQIISEMQNEALRIPLCATGNIALADVMPLLHIGVQGIAISQATMQKQMIKETIQQFLNADE